MNTMKTSPALASPDKSALRKALKARRARAYAELAKGGEAAAYRVPPALLDPVPKIVAGYAPIRDEFEPGGVLAVFRQRGARLALPVVPGAQSPLMFRVWDFGQPLNTNALGIREPTAKAVEVTPDLVIVPCLGWSQDGVRLGYGKGHYDRTLAGLRANGAVTAVGLAFEAQRVWDLPAEPHDQPLDWVITESAGYAVAPNHAR